MLPCPSGMLLVALTKLHWLLKDRLSPNVQGPIFKGKASKETLISGGVINAAAGLGVDMACFVGVAVALDVRTLVLDVRVLVFDGVGFEDFLVVDVVETGFFFVRVGLAFMAGLFLAILLGLALDSLVLEGLALEGVALEG